MSVMTVAFAGLVLINLCSELALAWRHIRHVAAHRDVVPVAFAATIDLPAHQKAADYTIARTRLSMVGDITGAAWLLLWTVGGGLQAVDAALRSLNWGALHTGVAVIVAVSLVSALLSLPLSLYRTFVLEVRFGFNKMTWSLYLADCLKGLVMTAVLLIPLLYAVLALMAATEDTWWLWVWLLWSSFSLLLLWLYPAVIAPLFNTFRPLSDDTLRARVQSLLDRCGFTSRGVFVMDGSRRSSHGNAYFTGFGRNKRVVFFDTLLQTLGVEEVEAVLAHELGHFKMRHVMQRLVWGWISSFMALWATHRLMGDASLYRALGVAEPSHHAALVLLMMVAPVLVFFFQPVAAWYSRRHEFEADAFAVRHADGRALVHALVKLYRDNASTLTPDPLHSLFYDSHPPASVRIARLQASAD